MQRNFAEFYRILRNFAELVFAFSLFNPRFSLKLMCHVCKLFHKKSRNSRHIACFLFYSRWWWRICFSTTLQSGNVQFPLLLLLCVSHSFQHGDGKLRKALLFYSVMIRCRRVESRLSTFQQRENRAISQTTSSRLLLGSQHYSKRVFQTLKILRIFPISRSRNGNDATGEAFSKSIVEPTT